MSATVDHLGMTLIDLGEVKPEAEALDLVDGDYALKHQVLPIKLEGNVLTVAIGGIDSLQAADDLGIILGKPIRTVLAEPSQIRDRIEERFIEDILSHLPSDEGTVMATALFPFGLKLPLVKRMYKLYGRFNLGTDGW